jgi:hypothetical protein
MSKRFGLRRLVFIAAALAALAGMLAAPTMSQAQSGSNLDRMSQCLTLMVTDWAAFETECGGTAPAPGSTLAPTGTGPVGTEPDPCPPNGVPGGNAGNAGNAGLAINTGVVGGGDPCVGGVLAPTLMEMFSAVGATLKI